MKCNKCLYNNTAECKAENCPPDKKDLKKATFREVMELMKRSKK